MQQYDFDLKRFAIITLITSIWVQISETFRYLVMVVPKMQSNGSEIPETTLPVLMIWIIWGTLLTALTVFLFWMYAKIFGNNLRAICISSTISWAFFFVLFWVGVSNMGLSDWNLLWLTLPLSWLELFVATLIASRLFAKQVKQELV